MARGSPHAICVSEWYRRRCWSLWKAGEIKTRWLFVKLVGRGERLPFEQRGSPGLGRSGPFGTRITAWFVDGPIS